MIKKRLDIIGGLKVPADLHDRMNDEIIGILTYLKLNGIDCCFKEDEISPYFDIREKDIIVIFVYLNNRELEAIQILQFSKPTPMSSFNIMLINGDIQKDFIASIEMLKKIVYKED